MKSKTKSIRGKSKMAKCDFCNNEFYLRGLKAHIRLKHKLELTQVTTKVISTKVSPLLKSDLSNNSSKISPKVKLPQSHSEKTQVPTTLLKSGGNLDLSKVVVITKVTEEVKQYSNVPEPSKTPFPPYRPHITRQEEIQIMMGELARRSKNKR